MVGLIAKSSVIGPQQTCQGPAMHAPGVLDSGTSRGSLAQFNIQPWLKQLNTTWSFRTDKVNLHALAHDPMPYVIYGAHEVRGGVLGGCLELQRHHQAAERTVDEHDAPVDTPRMDRGIISKLQSGLSADSSPVKEVRNNNNVLSGGIRIDHGALGRWGIGVGIPLWFTPIVTPPVRWKSVAFHARDIHSPHFSSENELRLFLDGVYPDN
ncbi:uncharacterized protein EI90DRAFT_3020106 [Cantharellus anzutake]|uniref:uncharacterized protein n=1 Tax=Cantharellus anzutake TaxID=1750568 RepID=UPI001906A816|nr:uncharacterized protein EI90DRAFT_3020106 [Cantharellus anzutake]KAF8322360.1 hypothetical protein EI90DRAFT_3020106 [Cantharellus anzutake]